MREQAQLQGPQPSAIPFGIHRRLCASPTPTRHVLKSCNAEKLQNSSLYSILGYSIPVVDKFLKIEADRSLLGAARSSEAIISGEDARADRQSSEHFEDSMPGSAVVCFVGVTWTHGLWLPLENLCCISLAISRARLTMTNVDLWHD